MDHEEALRLQAAVKYVLGELPRTERDSFEEHYFDCGECALDVRSAAAFADNARNVFRQEVREAPEGKWLAWFKPMVAVPAFAALLMIVAYQNMVTIPRVKQEAMRGAGQVFTSVFSLQMANTRGGEKIKIRVLPSEGFALKFDFTPAKAFNSYLCELQDASGRTLVQSTLPGASMNQEAEFAVRGGLVKPGEYNLVFTGVPDTHGQETREEVLRLGFLVEFLP